MENAQNKLHFYLADHLGSTRVVIDSAGVVKDRYRYLAFGAPETGQTIATNQPNRYTGKPYDEEANLKLYYYGARYYDPALGGFTQVDPLKSALPEWGPHLYVRDNPLLRVDPNGLTDITITVTREIWSPLEHTGLLTITNDGNDEVLTGFTLELPSDGNTENVSQVPEGEYVGVYIANALTKFNYDVIGVKGVVRDGNTAEDPIRFHSGSNYKNTKGCTLVGNKVVGATNKKNDEGFRKLRGSRKKMAEMTDYIRKILEKDKKEKKKSRIKVIYKNKYRLKKEEK